MKSSYRKILLATMLFLSIMALIWIDDLYLKTDGFLNYQYELIKIIIHSTLAYKVSKFIIIKFKLETKFKSINSNYIFLFIFLILNSYIIFQYSSRVFTHRILSYKVRKELNVKTKKLDNSGWGYECDSMKYAEFKELTKYTHLPNIPKAAKSIYVYDWYEFDFRTIIVFNLSPNFNLKEFYKNDTSILKNIETLKYEYNKTSDKLIEIDTTKFISYKWEVGNT